MSIIEPLAKAIGRSISIKAELDGYSSRNYHLDIEGASWVLKLYPNLPSPEDDSIRHQELEAQLKLLHILSGKLTDQAPRPWQNEKGTKLIDVNTEGFRGKAQLLEFLPGSFVGDEKINGPLAEEIGALVSNFHAPLSQLYFPALSARHSSWDLQHLSELSSWLDGIANPSERRLAATAMMNFRERVQPVFQRLPKSLIHGDANEWNILRHTEGHLALIDFGDVCCSARIADLAIAASYACYRSDAPVDTFEAMTEAYQGITALEDIECEVLCDLVAARLCQSVLHSAKAKMEQPDNDYTQQSEAAAFSLLEFWLSENPRKLKNTVLKIAGHKKHTSPTLQSALERRSRYFSDALSLSYSTPLHFEGASLQYMFDVHGKRYLDAYNNIPHVGHCHPHVVEAGQRQMATLNTNTRYLFDEVSEYAERLLNYFPETLSRVFFVNSGSAAADLAIRLARHFTGREAVLTMEHGYHGNTQLTIEMSHYKFASRKGSGQPRNTFTTTLPDAYRGEFSGAGAGKHYAQKALESFSELLPEFSAFITECIVGCGGQVPLAHGYLPEMFNAIRAHKGLCVVDEVQTGFGRMGQHFWAFEAHDVVPDIVILGKPMANGHPMGAVVCRHDIADAFAGGVEFFSSFGGNPVSCAIASAVLDVIENENLCEHAQTVGTYYSKRLDELKSTFSCIGDVRGSGLFLGIDIVKRNSKTPDAQLARRIKNTLCQRGILVSTDGPADNVIKSKPPLVFNHKNVDTVIENLHAILTEYT